MNLFPNRWFRRWGVALVATAVLTSGMPAEALVMENRVVAVATGSTHTILVTADNRARVLGQEIIPAGEHWGEALSGVKQVAIGHGHSLLLKADGKVWTWGSNSNGQLGDGTTTDRITSAPLASLSDVVQVAAGAYHSLALRSDGTVWAWGHNAGGQTGGVDYREQLLPEQVPDLANIVAIAAGADHSLAVAQDGTLWAWGADFRGQLGDGGSERSPAPKRVQGLPPVVDMAAGEGFSLAVGADGSLWSWGANYVGQLGLGYVSPAERLPVKVTALVDVHSVEASGATALALNQDDTLWSWGLNEGGQLGYMGNGRYQASPQQVPGLSDIVAVAVGGGFATALQRNGSVWQWGGPPGVESGEGAVGTFDRRLLWPDTTGPTLQSTSIWSENGELKFLLNTSEFALLKIRVTGEGEDRALETDWLPMGTMHYAKFSDVVEGQTYSYQISLQDVSGNLAEVIGEFTVPQRSTPRRDGTSLPAQAAGE